MEWISVKDKLPEEEMKVLVVRRLDDESDNLHIDIGNFFPTRTVYSGKGTYIENNIFSPEGCCESWDHDQELITHWMPMPESPDLRKRKDCEKCTILKRGYTNDINSCCYMEISQMRCYEHCGNTMSHK
jgi:hypothetical protein